MEISKIEAIIKDGLSEAQVRVEGDGHHFYADIVSPDFAGKARLQRQRMVNALLQAYIDSGELHAISYRRTATPDEA